MRLALLAVVLLLTGGAGAFYATKETAPSFASRYIALMEKHPAIVSKHVGETLQSCLPAGVDSRVQPNQLVQTFVADTIARSMLFTVQDKTPEEASRELVPWILERSKTLSAVEKHTFLALIREVNKVDVQLCIMSSLRESANFNLNASAGEWELRR